MNMYDLKKGSNFEEWYQPFLLACWFAQNLYEKKKFEEIYV